MEKYMQIVKDELKKHNLSVDDLTKEELADMLQEAKEISEDTDGKYAILDGYFGSSVRFANIQFRKSLKSSQSDK